MSAVDWYSVGVNAALHAPVTDTLFDWPHIRAVYKETLWKSGQQRSLNTYREFLKGYKRVVDDTRQWGAKRTS